MSGTEKLADDAYFFRRPGTDQGSGLILATTDVNTPNEITSVSVGSLTRNICTIERQLLSTPPKGKSLQPARVGIADDASNIVIAFAEYAQFHSVMWDAPTGFYAKPRATVSIKVIADLKDPRLPSSSNLFWTDVTLGNTTVRLFDIEPSAITDVVAVSGQLLTHESLTARDPVCGDFAKTQGIDLTNETVWGLRTKNSGGTDGQPYCLRVASFQDTAGSTVYSATLYGLRTTAAGVERDKDLPLINQLPLGANAPVEFRLNVHEGWMAFRVGIAWRAVPWSLDAFRVMAGKVFDAGSVDVKNSPPATSSTVNGNKRQGCGRPSDDPQFNVPYSLILGDMACPSDAVLKVVGRVVPASAPPAARTAGEATAR